MCRVEVHKWPEFWSLRENSISLVVVEMGSCYIGQAGLEFIGSSDPLTSASWITGTPWICCHAWLNYFIFKACISSKANEICPASNTANDSPYWFFIKIYVIWCSNTQITPLQKILKVTVKFVCSMMNYDNEVVSFFFLHFSLSWRTVKDVLRNHFASSVHTLYSISLKDRYNLVDLTILFCQNSFSFGHL